MNTQTKSKDTQIFSAMVEILVSSGLGEKGTEDYGLRRQDKRYDQTRYEELASVMNEKGYYNRAGKPLNRNSLKQMVHRVRQKKDLMDELKPADQYSQTFTISSISNSSEWILPSHPSGKLVSGSSPFSYLFKMIFSTSSGDRDSIIISSVTTSVRPSSWTKVIWYFTLYSVCQLFITKCPCKFLCASPSGVEQQTHTHVTF